MEITLVNASGKYVEQFKVWWGRRQEGFNLLRDLGRNLEPDESITVRIPGYEPGIYSFQASADAEGADYYCGRSFEYIPEGGIIVLPPDDFYCDIQTIFEAGTDVETAKETTLSLYQAAYEAEFEAAQEEETQEEETREEPTDLSQEEINEDVKLPGYDSLADMRTEEHPDIMFCDYGDEFEMQEHANFMAIGIRTETETVWSTLQSVIRKSGGINLIRKRAM